MNLNVENINPSNSGDIFEGFDANESDNNYQTFDSNLSSLNSNETKSGANMCKTSHSPKKNNNLVSSNHLDSNQVMKVEEGKKPLVENFFGRKKNSKQAAKHVVNTVKQIAKQAAPMVQTAIKESKAVVEATLETINKNEFKARVQKTSEDYMIMIRDTLIKVLSDPNSQHRVDEYIVKPVWDMYVIPFIDLYVIFMILYFVIFVLVTIWIVRPCLPQ